MMEISIESIPGRVKRLTALLNKSFIEKRTDTSSCLISRETLLDALILLYDECNNEFLMKDPLIADFVEKYRSTVLQIRDLYPNINDFETIKIICKGRFTEIVVAKEKSNGNVCVLKKIRKSDVLNLQEGIYFENERNLLLMASNHNEAKKWVPQLFYSFQNVKYLYYVLEFCSGGNLCTMAEYYKKNVPEPMMRFYLAEMIQAINCVHLLGFVHRDIKPDNILIDVFGHLRLIDFGSSAKMSKNGQVNSKLIVSIPHYTAPEIFKFQDVSTIKGYGCSCDWWSLGIVLFELITGSVPFTSDEIPKLYLSNNYSRKLQYGKSVSISQELKNIISGLLQPADKRLSYEKLINLNYFSDVFWDRLHDRDPPFVPSLSSLDDTSYFSTFEIQRPTPKVEDFKLQRRFTGRNLPFLGFTYLWNELISNSDKNYFFSSFIPPSSATVCERRKTDSFNRETENWRIPENQRHFTEIIHNSEIASECSNDSYQSAASVRLENEVTQLHLFYNEKALIIEEKLKNQFHDMYNCLTEEQRKFLLEKEQLAKQMKEKDEACSAEKESFLNKQKDLENKLIFVEEKLNEMARSKDDMKQMYEEQIIKFKKSEKLKKDTISKLNCDFQKLNKELDEKSEKMKDLEGKLLNLSNQQAAKLALLNKNKITLRSKSAERDKFEQENQTLKIQLDEANRKISKLTADIEKKGKMKLDLEFRMTANEDNVESSSKSAEDRSIALNQLNQKLQEKETELKKLIKNSSQIEKDCESRCQKMEELTKKLQGDLMKLKSDYNSLYGSNLKTVTRLQEVERELTDLEEKYKKSSLKKDSKLEKSWTEMNIKDKDIKELRQELRTAENNSRLNQNEIRGLREKLRNTEDEFRNQCTEKNNILAEKMNEIRIKDDELRYIQENLHRREKREKTLETEVGKLKEQISAKDKQITDLNEQLCKMSEDLFANLVSIEELKTVLHEKSLKITMCENEISNLKRDLLEKSQQVVNIRSSLSDSDEEKKMLESKIESLLNEVKESNAIKLKEIEGNKINSKELMKQFEAAVRDMLKENLGNKENTFPDLESMINTVQRKLSILSERPVLKENIQKDRFASTPAAILEAQVERLESQLDKARENAVLQREAAAQAKKELATVEKQLSDLKIDLRIAQREVKTAEEQVKLLQRSKYEYYKELKEQKENLEIQLNNDQEKLKGCEKELSSLKEILQAKDKDLNKKEMSIEAYSNETQSLKKKNEELHKEKSKIDAELNKKSKIIDELRAKVDQLKNETTEKDVNLSEVRKKENEWKTKYIKLEKTVTSVKETCVLLDKQVEHFENYTLTLNEKIEKLNQEKLDVSSKLKEVEEELKTARKSINEEKSLKLFAENQIRLLESEIRKKLDEEQLLHEDISFKTDQLQKAEEKIKQLEDYITNANESMEKGSQYTDFMKKEISSLKHERSELLTNLHRLKEENAELRKELKEAVDDLNDLQQANGELQSVLAQVERYHETRHLQDNTTLQQHSKLIEFLQNKYQDATAMRHKRTFADILFRSKGKENLYPKELENLLQIERSKSKGLAEQLYQAQIELMMLKGENISKCSSPKMTSEYESCLSRFTSVKNPPTSLSNFSDLEMPVNARLKHNIPHKFETKLCTKAGCKCIACGQTISFGHKISNCKECHVWSHVPCTIKVGPTCGLSLAMREQFSLMNKNPVQLAASLGSSVKSDIEGTIRVLKNKIWEKTVIIIQDKRLCLFDKSKSSSEAWEQISFDAILSVDDDKDMIFPALQSVTDSEKRYILRIVYHSDEKTEKIIYMLAASEEEKINWMNVLRRNISCSPPQVTFVKNKEESFKGNIVCEFNNSESLCINQVLQLSFDLCLLAANEGLFSLKLRENGSIDKPFPPVKIAGMDKVIKMKLLTKLKFAVVICDDNDVLKKCDLRMLVSNAEAAECASPYVLTSEVSNTVLSFKNCRLFNVSSCNNYLAVANSSYLMLLEWKDDGYDVMKYKRKISSVNCLLFTKEALLFSTANEYYSINLNTYTENKLNLFKCVYESTLKLCEPEAIIKISADLYLMCDKLFGIFVNGEGKRIKSAETMNWPLPLRSIVYNKPFLCIAHENSISLIYLPSSTENPEEKFKFIMINFTSPSILGSVKHPVRGIYLKENNSVDQKIVFLDPIVFMRRNPKQSWSSISTHSGGETTDEDCIKKTLNISDETDISLNSSILEDSYE